MAAITGYSASLTVSSYTGASIKNVEIRINQELVDVGDITTKWNEYQPGLASWEVSGEKGYASEAFLSLAHASVATSVAVTVTNKSGTTLFAGVGFIVHGGTSFPKAAAAGETITITGTGAPTTP